MSYQANVYKIFIASPGDVELEREIIRQVIHDWNTFNSDIRKIVLLPVGWETDAASEIGEHPQQVINMRVLSSCDLLVGVFWSRIGTPTEKYKSGTVEEIFIHKEQNKPGMLFFSNAIPPNDVYHIEQQEEIINFKKSMKETSLYIEYDDYDSFRKIFNSQLQLKLKEDTFVSFEKGEQSSGDFNDDHSLSLSNDAMEILNEASEDFNGRIWVRRQAGIWALQTNGIIIFQSRENRDIAKWKKAIEELIHNNLIESLKGSEEFYQVTDYGYNWVKQREVEVEIF